jgi:hypothetical protein
MPIYVIKDCFKKENDGVVAEFSDYYEALEMLKRDDEEADGFYMETIE